MLPVMLTPDVVTDALGHMASNIDPFTVTQDDVIFQVPTTSPPQAAELPQVPPPPQPESHADTSRHETSKVVFMATASSHFAARSSDAALGATKRRTSRAAALRARRARGRAARRARRGSRRAARAATTARARARGCARPA